MSSSRLIQDVGDAAISDYLARKDAGEVVDQNEFIARHPESADALRSFFTSELLFRRLIAQGHGDSSETRRLPPDPRAFAIARHGIASAPWPALPATFGRYHVTKFIGRGAMGTVYLAHDTELDRPVALKVPHRSPDGEAVPKDRHLQEARSAAGLRHPNICAVFDVGQIDGIDFIAMEYVEGRPLSDSLRRERQLPVATVAGLIRRLASALQAAHDQGVIHRDLKPGNILVRKDGEPVLMDFGLARRPLADGDERLSREGMMIGSPAYMAPEQARGEGATVGPAADIYGLGVVFYELLTGRLPFTGSVMTILAKILTEDPPSILLLRPDVDRELAGICHRMLSKRLEDRFGSMREVAEALKDWQGAHRTVAKTANPLEIEPARSPTAVLRRLRPQEVAMLTRSAARCLKQRDYAMAVKLLGQIPQSQHTEESSQTLHRAQDLAEEVDYLSLDIDDALASRDYSALETTLKRFRELQPHNRRVQELQRRLVRRGTGITLAPALSNVDSTSGFLKEHGRTLLVASLIVIVLSVLTWRFADRYLADPHLTIDVEVDDPTATVLIDGQELELAEGKGELRLAPGPHAVDAQLDGAQPQVFEFEVVRGRPNRLQIAFQAQRAPVVAAAAEPKAIPEENNDIERSIPEEWQENSIGMRFVRIPPGEFLMGSPASEAGREANEGPQRLVKFSESFLAAAYEVTQPEYIRVMRYNPSETADDGVEARTGRSKLPVDQVTWYDTLEFCNQLSLMEGRVPAYRLTNVVRNETSIIRAEVEFPNPEGYRLPTEEEWEYVCRAGTTTPFFFGTQCNGTQANVNGALYYGGALPGPSLRKICSVGTYPPNAFGVFDMHGNAGEWCWRAPTVVGMRRDVERDQPVRSGGITLDSRFARSAARREFFPGIPFKGLGFRVVRGPMAATVVDSALGSLTKSDSATPESAPTDQITSPAASTDRLIDFFTKKPIDRYQGDPRFVPVYTVEQRGYHWLGNEYDTLLYHNKTSKGQDRFRLLGYALSTPTSLHQRLYRHLFVSKDRQVWKWRYSFQSTFPEPEFVLDGTSDSSAELKAWVSKKEAPGRIGIRHVTKRENGNSFFFRDDEWQAMSSQRKAPWIDKGLMFYLHGNAEPLEGR